MLCDSSHVVLHVLNSQHLNMPLTVHEANTYSSMLHDNYLH